MRQQLSLHAAATGWYLICLAAVFFVLDQYQEILLIMLLVQALAVPAMVILLRKAGLDIRYTRGCSRKYVLTTLVVNAVLLVLLMFDIRLDAATNLTIAFVYMLLILVVTVITNALVTAGLKERQ